MKILAPGFLSVELEIDPRDRDDWSATLVQGALVTGQVRSEEDRGPRHGAVWLVALPRSDGPPGRAAAGSRRPAHSTFAIPDAAGRFQFRVPPSRYRLEYRRRAGDPHVEGVFELREGAERQATMTLRSP